MAIGKLLLSKFSVSPWAIHPGMFDIFTQVFNNKLLGAVIKPEIKIDREIDSEYHVIGRTAIIPMHGVILQKSMGMEGISGIVTTLNLEASLKSVVTDYQIDRIILDIDSPGGTVDGTKEVADLIYKIRQEKEVIAYANGLMASAAYWIGSAADEIIAGETSHVGSIGVYLMHVDQSKYNEELGIKVTYVKAGKYKTAGNPHEPLEGEMKDELQKGVDYIYEIFTRSVALHRGVSHEKVLTDMADGRIFIGEEARKIGLVDEIGNFDDLIPESDRYGIVKQESQL